MVEIPINTYEPPKLNYENVDRAVKYMLDHPRLYYMLTPYHAYPVGALETKQFYAAMSGLSPTDIREIAKRFDQAHWRIYRPMAWASGYGRPVVISQYPAEELHALAASLGGCEEVFRVDDIKW